MPHKIQIDDQVRSANAEELAIIEKLQDDAAEHLAASQTAAAAKQSAQNKLKALGLTDAEIAALVG